MKDRIHAFLCGRFAVKAICRGQHLIAESLVKLILSRKLSNKGATLLGRYIHL